MHANYQFKFLLKSAVFLILILLANCSYGQYAKTLSDSLFFKKGDRICFVGNSITNNGEFHHNVLLYHITRFPQNHVKVFNCGISGDVTGGIIRRMDNDILIHQPTVAVVMIGMNDMTGSLFGPRFTTNADTLQRRLNTLELYKSNLERIVKTFLDKNIRVILQKPSIYDQTAVLPTPILLGKNDALKLCAEFGDELAQKYNLPAVDYWSLMMKINTEQQKTDPAFTITSKDRVHPDATGHLVMAYQFLRSENAPRYVSGIIIENNLNQSSQSSFNCEVKSLKRKKNIISFQVLEHALPFPVVESQHKGIFLVPFVDDLNFQLLQVNGISNGPYELTIDSISIGTFSGKQLQNGINLAEFSHTPQYRQANKVREVLAELWKYEANLRNIKFIDTTNTLMIVRIKTIFRQ